MEADTGLAPGGGPRERPPGSVVYRLTPGRRYLPEAFRDLVALDDARLATIEAIPESGTLVVSLDPDRVGADASRALLPRSSPSTPWAGGGAERRLEIGIERGGPAEHVAAEAMRMPETRAIERRLEQAVGAWSRAWQADYL